MRSLLLVLGAVLASALTLVAAERAHRTRRDLDACKVELSRVVEVSDGCDEVLKWCLRELRTEGVRDVRMQRPPVP